MAELDLDAIRTRQAARRWALTLGPDGNMARAVGDITALLALVRRLQQENERLEEELTDAANVEISKDFLITTYRGRVEELTEALRELLRVGPAGSYGFYTNDAMRHARAVLAGVVPE